MQNQKTAKNNGHTNNGNNGHNGHSKQRVQFVAIKFRINIAERFKNAAVSNEMDYSDFLEELLKSEVFEQLFNDPQNRDAMAGFIKHIAKRAMETPSRDAYRF